MRNQRRRTDSLLVGLRVKRGVAIKVEVGFLAGRVWDLFVTAMDYEGPLFSP
ncbi:hypothetical protein NUBL13790_51340 [Klebsiella pneumoniae]|nr:hypothetical protein NUBL13790_51340 [Klebsiella pneumoniae]